MTRTLRATIGSAEGSTIAVSMLLALAANALWFDADPGFMNTLFSPYALLALVSALYLGIAPGVMVVALAALQSALALPGLLTLLGKQAFFDPFELLLDRGRIPIAWNLLLAGGAGLVRLHILYQERERWKADDPRNREVVQLQEEISILKTVNSELDKRISRQTDSVMSLQNQVLELGSLNLEKTFDRILQIVEQFTAASSIVIWEYIPERNLLVKRKVRSTDEKPISPATLPLEHTAEGWSYRNNRMFSVRMLNEKETLGKLEKPFSVVAVPIHAGRRTWGILSIEDLPFEKYHSYTERIVQLLLALVSPKLEQALEHDTLTQQGERNDITGFHSYPYFCRLLDREVDQAKMHSQRLSIVIFELVNAANFLTADGGYEDLFRLFVTVSEKLQAVAENQVTFFHYQRNNQFCVLCHGMDFDGVSQFSLDAIQVINGQSWTVRGQEMRLEMIIGMSSMRGAESTGENLRQYAEELLEFQKL